MSLRVFAFSAPQYPEGGPRANVLSGVDPVSMYNACRVAAWSARFGSGPWADSNFSDLDPRGNVPIVLYDDLVTARIELDRVISRLRPNLVLIGAMTLCLRGAFECAAYVKEMLGDQVCIVLGGHHVSESMYLDESESVCHHASSPLRLMADGEFDSVVDIVVAGEAEYVVEYFGIAVEQSVKRGKAPTDWVRSFEGLAGVPGRWIVGTLSGDKLITAIGKQPLPDDMPVPCELFGVRTRFSVFDDMPTAQIFSDIGSGCIYDCAFCSEAISIVGRPRAFTTSADRLARQFFAAETTIASLYGIGSGGAAFVEDSTLLGMNPKLIARFGALLARNEHHMVFGGQATVDQILRCQASIRDLAAMGLRYLFVGLETASPENMVGFHKRRRGDIPWLRRAETAISILEGLGVRVGVSVLFGLGEKKSDRDVLFRKIAEWQSAHLDPQVVSMNWAVQHPLKGRDGGAHYKYAQWLSKPSLLPLMRFFGEASTSYPIAGLAAPSEGEILDVIAAYEDLPLSGDVGGGATGSGRRAV